jgi:glutamate dehydrogenase (NAD(P)+)
MAPGADSSLPVCHGVMRGSDLLGFIAIDSSVGGRARGGLRLVPDLSEDEVRDAARAMTLKYGLLGLPQGGAKAGVIGDPDADPARREEVLREFARAAEPFLRDRRYVPDSDLGTQASDIRTMMESIGMPIGPREWRANRSGDHTARSCLAAVQAISARLGRPVAGSRVAIEGFGKVGSRLAQLLHDRGARVVAVSTARGAVYDAAGLDVPALQRRASEAGSGFVAGGPGVMEKSRLLELPVDLLCPCARRHSIHAGNADRIAARAIVPGANNPLSPDAEGVLERRGVACLPDFVSNCGGVLGGTLEFAGGAAGEVGALVERRVERYVSRLLERAERTGRTPRSLAESDALDRHALMRARAEAPGLMARISGLGIEAYRRRWLPEAVVSRIAAHLVARHLA